MPKIEEVQFFSEGNRLVGEIWFPDEYQNGEKRAAWIFVEGIATAYTAFGIIPDLFHRLTRQGYIGLTFDFPGFGKSSQEKPIVNPFRQVRDVQNAITYLQTRVEVDEDRIGIGGISLGGSVTPYVAGIDGRVSATVALWGFGSGRRVLKSAHSLPQWRRFLADIEEDRKQRVLKGQSRMVRLDCILPVQEHEKKFFEKFYKMGWMAEEIQLQSAEEMINFSPEDVAHQISKPILYVHPIAETLVEYEESVRMYEKTGGPKSLWLIPTSLVTTRLYDGVGHFEKDDTSWAIITDTIIRWMKNKLSPEPRKGTEKYSPPDLDIGFASPAQSNSWLRT